MLHYLKMLLNESLETGHKVFRATRGISVFSTTSKSKEIKKNMYVLNNNVSFLKGNSIKAQKQKACVFTNKTSS